MSFWGGTVDSRGREVRPRLSIGRGLDLVANGYTLSLMAQAFELDLCCRELLLVLGYPDPKMAILA